MADSLACSYVAKVSVTETLGATNDLLFASAGNRAVIHDQFNTTETLSSTTTPPITKVASFRQALAAGVATIDLTSLTGTHGATVDGTGLKVMVLRLKALSTNTAIITIDKGAANGYELSAATWSVTLAPGDEYLFKRGTDVGTDIAAGAKDIDLAGTGVEAVDVTILMG